MFTDGTFPVSIVYAVVSRRLPQPFVLSLVHHVHKHGEQVNVAFVRRVSPHFSTKTPSSVHGADRVHGAVLFSSVELRYLVRGCQVPLRVDVGTPRSRGRYPPLVFRAEIHLDCTSSQSAAQQILEIQSSVVCHVLIAALVADCLAPYDEIGRLAHFRHRCHRYHFTCRLFLVPLLYSISPLAVGCQPFIVAFADGSGVEVSPLSSRFRRTFQRLVSAIYSSLLHRFVTVQAHDIYALCCPYGLTATRAYVFACGRSFKPFDLSQRASDILP